MSIAAPRRVGIAGLLGLLAGAIVVMPAPRNPGALRLAGVGLLWWYAALAAPLAAVLLVIVVRRASPEAGAGAGGSAALAAWTSPVVLALVAARVFSGAPEAPTIALAILVAPLIALLCPATDAAQQPNRVAALGISAGVGLVLWANLSLLADVAGLLGFPRWATSIVAASAALLAVALLRGDTAGLRNPGLWLLYVSGLGFVALVTVVAVAVAASPWSAWKDVASRPALTFGARNPWVTEGRTLAAALTLVGGAVALVVPERALTIRAVCTGSGLVLAFVLGALCLGVYGAYAAPGLSIGAPALAAVFGVPDAVVPGRAGSALGVLSAVVLVLLLSATVLALRGVLGRAWGEASTARSSGTHPPRALTDPTVAFLVVAASIGSLWPGDASRALLAGLGLTASAAVAPRVAGDSPEARLAGSLVGVIAFAGLSVLGPGLPAWADVAWTYPALAAAPLAWVVVRAETVRRARRALQ